MSRRIFDEQEGAKVVALYRSGLTLRAIAEKYGVSDAPVKTALRRAGARPRNASDAHMDSDLLDPTTEATLPLRYRQGESVRSIAKSLGVSDAAIRLRLQRANILLRSRRESLRKYRFNQSFFSCIDTHERAYFLGLMMADGSVTEVDFRASISLNERDRETVAAFRRALGSTTPIHVRQRERRGRPTDFTAIFNVYSEKTYMALNRLGCVPNKTDVATVPKIPPHLWPSMVCGWFDGDGSISWNRNKRDEVCGGSWEIVGTEAVAKGLADMIRTGAGVEVRTEPRRRLVWRLSVGGVDNILKVCEWMYSQTPHKMPRKWAKYMRMKRDSHCRKPIYRDTCDCGEGAAWKGYCVRCYQRLQYHTKKFADGPYCLYVPENRISPSRIRPPVEPLPLP